MDSKWGLEHVVEEKGSVHVPALVFLAFGMNDGCDTEGISPCGIRACRTIPSKPAGSNL